MENYIIDKPSQIFNTDKTGLPLDPASLKVVVGTNIPKQLVLATKVTVLACCNSAGYTIPPLVIFKSQDIEARNDRGGNSRNVWTSSEWIDTELFKLWFTHHFPVRPLLLLPNAHSSHFLPSFVRRAAEEQVIVFYLPPHTTHLTQPLDKECFSPLNMFWQQECQSYLSSNPGNMVTRFQFASHGEVNHSVMFVDLTVGVHTEPVESYWGRIKKLNRIKRMPSSPATLLFR